MTQARLTVAEAAARRGVSVRTIAYWIHHPVQPLKAYGLTVEGLVTSEEVRVKGLSVRQWVIEIADLDAYEATAIGNPLMRLAPEERKRALAYAKEVLAS